MLLKDCEINPAAGFSRSVVSGATSHVSQTTRSMETTPSAVETTSRPISNTESGNVWVP